MIIRKAYKENRPGLNPVLLLACTIGALVIPSVSHDYTLSFLVAPVVTLFLEIGKCTMDKRPFVRLVKCVMVVFFSTTYASTLFSYANKPDSVGLLYQNNFPVLITLLIFI